MGMGNSARIILRKCQTGTIHTRYLPIYLPVSEITSFKFEISQNQATLMRSVDAVFVDT